MDNDIKKIFAILDNLEGGLDTPPWYFVFVRDSYQNIFDEYTRIGSNMPIQELLSIFTEQMYEYSDMARTKKSSDMFSVFGDISKMVLASFKEVKKYGTNSCY
jgi:hypothetical protein